LLAAYSLVLLPVGLAWKVCSCLHPSILLSVCFHSNSWIECPWPWPFACIWFITMALVENVKVGLVSQFKMGWWDF